MGEPNNSIQSVNEISSAICTTRSLASNLPDEYGLSVAQRGHRDRGAQKQREFPHGHSCRGWQGGLRLQLP
jgi:hypothetical protein